MFLLLNLCSIVLLPPVFIFFEIHWSFKAAVSRLGNLSFSKVVQRLSLMHGIDVDISPRPPFCQAVWRSSLHAWQRTLTYIDHLDVCAIFCLCRDLKCKLHVPVREDMHSRGMSAAWPWHSMCESFPFHVRKQ